MIAKPPAFGYTTKLFLKPALNASGQSVAWFTEWREVRCGPVVGSCCWSFRSFTGLHRPQPRKSLRCSTDRHRDVEGRKRHLRGSPRNGRRNPLLKNPANPDNMIKLKWENVTKLAVTHPIPFHLKEGTVLNGTATPGPDGVLVIQAEPLKGTMEVPMSDVKSVNPLIQPSVIYVGNLTGGYSQTTGNSQLRNASLLGELVARSELLRLTMNVRVCIRR